MGDVLRFDAERLRILVERHHLHTGSARARALLEDWDNALQSFVKVMPTRLQARAAAGARAGGGEGRRGGVRDHGVSMGKPTGFLEIERKDRSYEKVEPRLKNWQGVRAAAAAGRGLAAGRALHGLRHSVLSQRLPGQQP